MSGLFTQPDAAILARPHVARAWFAKLDLPSGVAYLHNGAGTFEYEGISWRGVSDPLGAQIVSLSQVTEPAFGQASFITITLSGANKEFLKSVHATARQIEGRRADIYFAVFDQETQKILIPLRSMFGKGKMTAPAIEWTGIGTRRVSITIESIWSALNFAPGGMWNPSGQQSRYPGDLGMQYVGTKIQENWQ